MKYTRIVGFDPASKRNLGWAVVEVPNIVTDDGPKLTCFAGTFVMPDCQDVSEVQWPLFTAVDTLLQHQEPDVVIVEKTSQFSARRASFITGQVSHCMGTIFAACGKNEIEVKYVSPTHVKKVISEDGRATKSKMKKSTKSLLDKFGVLDVKFDSEHAYDAAASVLCYLMDNKIIGVDNE